MPLWCGGGEQEILAASFFIQESWLTKIDEILAGKTEGSGAGRRRAQALCDVGSALAAGEPEGRDRTSVYAGASGELRSLELLRGPVPNRPMGSGIVACLSLPMP
jgi:hypothetical protein